MSTTQREVAFEAALAGLRRTLAPLGATAIDAVRDAACEADVTKYIDAACALASAMFEFSGTEESAAQLERAAAAYRAALRAVCDRVGTIALESIGTDRPQ